jgi:hypothetical protein
MKSNYKIRAMRFIEQIFPYIENCGEYVNDYRKAVNRFNHTRSRRVILAHGISRVAFITSDYVVKMDYDPYEIERVGGGESEEKFYAFAKMHGFSYLFAEVTSYTYHGKTFYIMPRIGGIGKYEDDVYWFLTSVDRDFVEDYLYDMHNLNYGWKDGYPVIIDYACNKLTCA